MESAIYDIKKRPNVSFFHATCLQQVTNRGRSLASALPSVSRAPETKSYRRNMFSNPPSLSQQSPARRENDCRKSSNTPLFSFAHPHHSSENVRHAPQNRRDDSKNGEEIKENRELFVIFPLVFPANARLLLPFCPIPTTSVALSKCHSPFCVRWSVIHIPLNADKAIIQLYGI